ncbi:MAG: ABC transporter ATP-binding protein [Actinomycetia bacterium]|nr:ABC transporter ATP-binding protein [Actinomycetes bacterium]
MTATEEHRLDAATPFEPVAVERRYPPPRARLHPAQSLRSLRRVLPIVLAHRRLFFGSLVLALISMLLQVSIPAVIRSAIDQALTERSAPLSGFVVALLILGLTRALATFAYRYGLYRMAFEIDTDLRVLLYDHLNSLSFSFYDRTQSGQVISRANSDIRSVQMFLVFAPIISMTMVMFIAALGFMLSIHVWLTLVAVLPLPGVYFLGAKLRRDVFPLSWIVQSRTAEIATLVDENINGVRVVRSFAAERAQIVELAKGATRLRWAGVRTIEVRGQFNPFIENLPRVGTLMVLIYGGWLVIERQITEGTLFAFSAYVLMLQVPFRTLGLFLIFSQRARASAGRIYEVLDEQAEIVDRADAVHLPNPQGTVVFDDVRFAYNTTDPAADPASPAEGSVLRGLNLRIEAGETVAIVGRTGSGKSTIARLLARFYDVDSGAVTVDDHDVRDVTQVSLRAAVGIVADDPFLFSISLADNIAYARPTADMADVIDAATAAQAHEFISALPDGYDEVVGERGYTLSGGQRQRVALARTLLANPKILVLDDATSAIDVHVEELIHEALKATMTDRTTIIIAHRLSTIALADRVVLLDDGRVAASGTHRELLANEPRYADIVANFDDDPASVALPGGGT